MNKGFGKYSSKVKRVNIPLPSFEYVHKSWFPGRISNDAPGFMIGRDRIIEKLKTWLVMEKSKGGSYLITGYRGMGKTSFVDRVLFELVAEAGLIVNFFGLILFFCMVVCGFMLIVSKDCTWGYGIVGGMLAQWIIYKRFFLKEKMKKALYGFECGWRLFKRRNKIYQLNALCCSVRLMWGGLTAKEWDRINNLVYGTDVSKKSYSNISVSVSLGQEILDERSILCVLTSQLHDRYRRYVLSPVSNGVMWLFYGACLLLPMAVIGYERISLICLIEHYLAGLCGIGLLGLMAWHQIRNLTALSILKKRIDAEMKTSEGVRVQYKQSELGTKMEYSYPIANIRDIESQLIAILDRIERFPIHPTFYFVFDELDKIETPIQSGDDTLPEYSGEKYLATGGTSRKRKFTVMHLLANMKFFTTTAKAKFLFIAGREMYDAYLADLTDRESAISSLFNGVIYVESFCKNEKSDKDVIYNTETFISRQLLPKQFVADKVMDKFIECKLKDKTYTNIDINLKLYFEYLTLVYTDNILGSGTTEPERIKLFNAARAAIDKTVGLLYHFTVYLYHVSNGSPKKMRLNFERGIRPLRNTREFLLTKKRIKDNPLEGQDLDIYIPKKCRYLLSFSDREQRVIGFIHYISFPVNQIITDANQFGDKLLVSASFLINHLYKYHSGGFSWRNIEQTPELLEVYKIPEFRGFINSILTYLLQTHIIQIPCGLYQFKFRKQISEEISLASKVSEEVSAIFNFTLDESQSVKRHYMEIQRKYLIQLKENRNSSPHSIAGLHHILADLYMADEEYNQAILEYQTALKVLDGVKTDNENSHQATFTLAYIRNMLKLGAAFEKRKTYASAYNTYNEIIDRLIRFREFDESMFGLKYVVKPTDEWPYYDALLYNEGLRMSREETRRKEPIRRVVPQLIGGEENLKRLVYKSKGNHMISDFSHQMTPDKHTVIQRLAMLEDTQIVYQALLAKLFINEKIELGGITRSNLDVIEGEYKYIHLTANEKEKFLISTDFFRRLGDVMFYKNGLISFNYAVSEQTGDLNESFVDSLYYWAFNIETEIQDYCTANKCYELFTKMLTEARKMSKEDFEKIGNVSPYNPQQKDVSRHMYAFWEQKEGRLKKLPKEDIDRCREIRKKMWIQKRTMPCFACKYYNRSLRIIMRNLFGIEAEEIAFESGWKGESKTIRILRQIVKNGSAKSMRQNYMIQFAEVLDCLGNTTLSCCDIDIREGSISPEFLSKFLHDVHEMNVKMDGVLDMNNFLLLTHSIKGLSKLETCILYYWEAYICFRYGREQKKAFCSLKKILRVIQNYLRVTENMPNNNECIERKACIGEFLNEIKNRIIKQSLICLYSHYNFINMVEIQQLKWIFYTQMYENISLSRLSLFPDVEEMMLIYYEIISLCIIDKAECEKANRNLVDIRACIYAYSRSSMYAVGFTSSKIEERNEDFENRLVGIYNNLSMGALRHENTVYERVLSLRMKMILNRHILFMAFPHLKGLWNKSNAEDSTFVEALYDCLIYHGKEDTDDHWKRFFPEEDFCDEKAKEEKIGDRLRLLEFLIQDSIYCLTSILETITPYTTTTLFTHSFLGSIYYALNKWNFLFDILFCFYKFFDDRTFLSTMCNKKDSLRENVFKQYDEKMEQGYSSLCKNQCMRYCNKGKTWQSKCPYYRITGCGKKDNRLIRYQKILHGKLKEKEIDKLRIGFHDIWHCRNLSDRFFESILSTIGKHNIRYILTNYSGEMSLKSYRCAKEVHREGRAYKEMISRMFYLDDDLKNDTIQFDLALERFKINCNYIDANIKSVIDSLTDSIYDVENFCTDNEARATLKNRFPDLYWNIAEEK